MEKYEKQCLSDKEQKNCSLAPR